MKFLYINLSTNNTRDKVTIRGLKECGASVTEIVDNSHGLSKLFNIASKYRKLKVDCNMIIVGYTGGILVPLVRLISKKKIVYNALASLYEAMVVARGNGLSLKAPWYYMIDFCAFHLAHYVVVESVAQKKYIKDKFFIRGTKIIVNYTGVDDKEFYLDSTIKKLAVFTVVFRGKFMPEAGIEVLIRAALKLEDEGINIRIIGNGFLQKKISRLIAQLSVSNLEYIDSYLPFDVLRQKVQECHLALGQLSNHPRLLRTIPHKAFESLAMKLPYLTARKGAIMELLKEKETAFFFTPEDSEDLIAKILFARHNPEITNSIASSGYSLFQKSLTPKMLINSLLQNLQNYEV